MKDNGLSITAFVVVILSIVATLATIAFSDGIKKVDWISFEGAAWSCFGLAILGCILGWCSFKRGPLGKISATLGTVVVAGFFFQLLRSEAPTVQDATPRPRVMKTKSEPIDALDKE